MCSSDLPAKQTDVSRDKLRNSVSTSKGGQRAGSTTKKNGAGGRGTWGKVGDEYAGESVHALDKGDPNYDPAEDDTSGHVMVASEP